MALSGVQTPQIGPLALALYYDPAEAEAREPLATKDDRNECDGLPRDAGARRAR